VEDKLMKTQIKTRAILFSAFPLVILALAACDFPTSPSACTADELVAPGGPYSPAPISMVSTLDPVLSWTYPTGCEPEGFSVQLSTERDFSDTSLFGTTSTSATNWRARRNLDPGKQYYWRVAAISGTAVGPFSHLVWFTTGPLCDASDLAATVLESPSNRAVVNSLAPMMRYTSPNYGSCSPHQFWIDLSTDSTFSSGSPWFETEVTAWAVSPADPLLDCTMYYWRVAEMNGSTRGPLSATWSFLTDESGSCGFVLPDLEVDTDIPLEPFPSLPLPLSHEEIIPLSAPMATFTKNANCRIGPGTAYDVVTSLIEKQEVLLKGRNSDNSWWWALLPDSRAHCWVSDSVVEVIGPVVELPIIAAPPLPTDVPKYTPMPPTPKPPTPKQPTPKPPTPQPSPPAAPTKLVISSRTCSDKAYSVTLSWKDNAGNELGYRVYREAQLIAKLKANATKYKDNPPGSGPYTYNVEAFNEAGASGRPSVHEEGCLH
jgi:hypothetical protein